MAYLGVAYSATLQYPLWFGVCLKTSLINSLKQAYAGYSESTRQCKRHRFDPRSGRIPLAVEQLSWCAQLLSLCSGAWGPHPLSPLVAFTEAHVPLWFTRGRPPQWAARSSQRGKSSPSNRDPAQPKTNTDKIIKKKRKKVWNSE